MMIYDTLNTTTKTIMALLAAMARSYIDFDGITVITVEQERTLYKWGKSLTITIEHKRGNIYVSADCDGWGEITENNIENVIFYFAGQHGAGNIEKVTCEQK